MIALFMPGVVVALIMFVLFYVVPVALIVWIVKKLTKR